LVLQIYYITLILHEKTERKVFLRLGMRKTSSNSKELPNWSQKGMVPNPTAEYLASSPSSN
jgi:hypothetical protein